ncbi:MAG: glycosyl hydrolase [Gemmatimonadota bacterium]|nr:glycosyl hydrolase [Gemmatimonadota bacterium]
MRSFRMPPTLAFVGTLILTLNTLHAQQLDPARYARLQYRHLGPEGNRASAVAGEPGNPMVAYIGAASGGVWKSADGGVTWKPTFDAQTAQAIGALAVAPSAPNVVWAGTGETFIIRSPTSPGNGIYQSTDAGETWRHMGLDASGHIGRILVHPRDAEVVYACVLGHAYGPQEERGVYRTTDGGTTWARVLFVDPNTGCSDLAMDATDPGVLVAGMWQFEIKPWNLNSGGPGSGVFITRDAGDTWTRLVGHGLPKAGSDVGKVAVAIAPSDPGRMYALLEQADPTLYRSDDGGASWRIVTRNHDIAERAPYYTRFAVSPDDRDRLYFVSVRFSVSKDGGATLVSGYGAGGDNHDIWIDPRNPDRYMVAHDGGVSITLNRGESYRRIVLPIAQMYHVFTDTRVPYHVYGNRQDGYSYRGPSNTRSGGGITEGHWHSFGGCESGFGIPDTVSNTIVWSGCYDGGLQRYDLMTGQARDVRVWPEGGYGWAPAGLRYRWNWTFPVVLSPHDPNHVYVGSQYVHETTDGGQTWHEISPDLTTNDTTKQRTSGGVAVDNLMTFDAPVLHALAESPLEAGVLWAGSGDGLVHVTRDGGGTWANVTANIRGLPTWGKVTAIVPSRYDAGTAYVVVDRHEMADFEPYVFKATEYGKTWRRIDAGIPRSVLSYAHTVAEDAVRRGMLFVGTENGLYFTRDDGAHWQPLQLNLPHAPVSWITVQPHFGDLVVSTYGRGIWILDDLTSLRTIEPGMLDAPLHLFAPRPAYRFRAIHNVPSAPSFSTGQNPRYGATIDYHLRGDPADTTDSRSAQFVVLDAAGDTVRTFTGPAKPGLNRAWWDLRYAGAREPRLRTPPPGRSWVPLNDDGWRRLVVWDLDLSTRGGLAPPGVYTIVVAVGADSATTSVEVRKDPYSTGTEADIRQQVELALELRADLDRTVDMINRIEWIKKQLADMRGILDDKSTVKDADVAAALRDSARAVEDRAIEVAGALFDVNLTGAREDSFRAPMRLYGRLAALLSDVAENGADFPPTTQQLSVHDVLHARLDDAARAFEAWVTTDLARFRQRVRDADLPDIVP